ELLDAEHVHEFVHLLLDLLERVLLAVDAERDARDVGAFRGPDGEALDVEAAPREHARDPHQRAWLVLDEDRQRVFHRPPSVQIAFLDREKQARLGRRERSSPEATGTTEDDASRSFAATRGTRAAGKGTVIKERPP